MSDTKRKRTGAPREKTVQSKKNTEQQKEKKKKEEKKNTVFSKLVAGQ